MPVKREVIQVAGRDVAVTNPDKLYFPQAQITKLRLVEYYLAVADAAIRGVARRPQIMKRYVDGITGEPFFQKRVTGKPPPWITTARFTFPSGRVADEVTVQDAAQLVWVVNLGCIDLNPHAVRAEDMDHPDELRIDLDPVPGVAWPQIVEVAQVARAVLADVGLVGWPKTSGSRGIHIWVRIEPRWTFAEVRRAGLALAREVERRAPDIATSKWWKEERRGVFLDYNQNARDRTTASAYSVRPTPDARVSMPLTWDQLATCNPADYTLFTVPALVAERGDAHAAIDDHAGVLDGLFALADAQDRDGLPDAPYPPHYRKQAGEAARVAPSRARTPKFPVLIIARAKHKADALAGLDRWKARHPDVAAQLQPDDILVDAMRGRATAWYRVRVNLKNVPADQHPPQETVDPDYDPRSEYGLGDG